jgi:hypothetical protein
METTKSHFLIRIALPTEIITFLSSKMHQKHCFKFSSGKCRFWEMRAPLSTVTVLLLGVGKRSVGRKNIV